nr:10231_t:CDS:2 [Entrophospora candida]
MEIGFAGISIKDISQPMGYKESIGFHYYFKVEKVFDIFEEYNKPSQPPSKNDSDQNNTGNIKEKKDAAERFA